MILTGRGVIFVVLNAIRIVSLIALFLVFLSNILIMVKDIKSNNVHIDAGKDDPEVKAMLEACGYIDNSTVPNQVGGIFYAVLNRFLILFCVAILVLSEIGWPMKFFNRFFPVLGSDFGVGALGAFQCLIGASILSHHIDLFPLVSAWMLFVVGCLNAFVIGLVFREGAKRRRSLNPVDDFKSTIKSLKPSFPSDFTKVEISAPSITSHYTGSSIHSYDNEKTTPPSYFTSAAGGMSDQARKAFGRATEKVPVLGRPIITSPPEAHPHSSPRIISRQHPTFESSPNAV